MFNLYLIVKKCMSKKLNIILSVVIGLVACAGIILGSILINNSRLANTKGSVTIELVDLDEKIVSSNKIRFKEEDSLVSIVSNNYENVTIENGMLLSIEDFTTDTVNWRYYISILVNGDYSNFGINDIELVDGMIITFKLVEYIPYE